MPKVVGKDDSAVIRKTHRACGMVIEYVPNDIIILWSGTDYSGGSDGAKGFKCPHCGENFITERW